jgi:flagellar biogenesis protein FliO
MEVFEALAAVAGVLGSLAAALWWLRKRGWAVPATGRRNAGRRLECLERLPLAPQHTLHLVRLGGRVLLLASTPAGCALLESGPLPQNGLKGEEGR